MSPPPTKPVLGLIGGIGSGKSRVAQEFAHNGGFVIVADQLGHEALRQPEVKEKLIRRWGREILNAQGEIDRKKVGGIVFANEEELRALEAEVFPYIEKRIVEETARARAEPTSRFIVLDAAILLEAGWSRVCDQIVYVHTPRSQRLQRVATQRGWSEREVRQRERRQLSLTAKVTRANHVLDNAGDLTQLAAQVRELVGTFALSAGNPT